MDEWKSRPSNRDFTPNWYTCNTQTLGKSRLAAMSEHAPVTGDARILRCPPDTLERLRHLNEAEVITLFTPFVPHPPSSTLAKDMDPFEPLGRALPRKVRHVPYRLEAGMTEMHGDFLPASGAVVIVICVTANIISQNASAFDQQVNFARDISRKIGESDCIPGIPIIMLLADDVLTRQHYANSMEDFPAVVVIRDYTSAALKNSVRILFGE